MFVYSHPDPVALALGPLHVRWYGLMYLVGFLAGWWLARRRAAQPGSTWTPTDVDDLVFYCAVGVIFGGRLGWMLFYGTERLLDDPASVIRIWEGGMSFHGGLIGVIVALAVFARSRARKLVDVDYHVAMGGRAYGTLADSCGSSARGRALAGVFAELAAKFQRLVDALNDVSEMSWRGSDRDVLRNLERNLKLVIYGQDKAIDTLSAAIKMSRSGLGDQRKPVGSFLFAGPTGVGKTEVTRQLALALGVELIRFDMSEYMERHTVSRLIGAPPGYVGFDQGGLLTEAITKNPHCVLLLDEIEKAHPDVFNLLLQVMDHGTLTDNNGRKADFRHVVIVMTTNAGAADISRASIGFVAQDHATDGVEAIKKVFSPEFRNRLDAVVQFAALDETTIHRVVDKLLVEVEAQLETKGVALHVDDDARAWIAKRGYDPKMGARPMARVIQEHIKRPLAEELLFGRLEKGGQAFVSVGTDDQLKVETRSTDEPALLE